MHLDEHDSEPVSYCPQCFSLRIRNVDDADDLGYCMDCGCSEIAQAPIGEWEALYRKRYGHAYLDKEQDPERIRIGNMSMDDLIDEVYKRHDYKMIIRQVYPGFEFDLDKEETILVFFDRICKDNTVDVLRDVLTTSSKYYGRAKDTKGEEGGSTRPEGDL